MCIAEYYTVGIIHLILYCLQVKILSISTAVPNQHQFRIRTAIKFRENSDDTLNLIFIKHRRSTTYRRKHD